MSLKLYSPSKYSPCGQMQQSKHRSQRKCCQGPPVICWQPLTAFPLKILDNVSSTGSGAGIAASGRRANTSKETNFQTCTITLSKFFLQFREFLGPPTYVNSTNIPPIMIINRMYETQNLVSLQLVSFLVGLRTYQHHCEGEFTVWSQNQ